MKNAFMCWFTLWMFFFQQVQGIPNDWQGTILHIVHQEFGGSIHVFFTHKASNFFVSQIFRNDDIISKDF